jgi:putative inorganic carbon (HCO3(-)) transporter
LRSFATLAVCAASRTDSVSRAAPQNRWWPVALGLPVALSLLAFGARSGSGTHSPLTLLGLAVAGLIVVYTIWHVPPSWTMSAGLVLTMFGGNWQDLGLPQSVAPDRIVLGLGMLAIAIRAPSSQDRPPIRFRSLYALMYVAGAYAIGSAIAVGTISNHGAIFDLLDRMQMFQWLMIIIVPAAFSSAADRRVFLATLVAMGVYLGFTGIFEILGPHALVFPRYINNPHVGVHFGRARGPFTQAAVMGLALYACFMASLIALREWRSGAARLGARLAIAVCAISLLLTFERTIWIGVAVAAPVTLLAVQQLRRYILPTLAGVGVLIAVAFAIPSVRHKIDTRISQIGTVQNRQALDVAALNMVEAHPLFGFGWGRFIQAAPNYFSTSDSYSVEGVKNNPVHDVYASIAAELGLVGLALWLAILFAGVGGAALTRGGGPEIRRWQIALGSVFVLWLSAGLSSPLGTSFQSTIIWMWSAVVLGAMAPEAAGARSALWGGREALPSAA